MNEPMSNAGAFAAAIAHRYRERPLIAPRLDLTMRLNPRTPAAQIFSFNTRMEIAPRLALTLVNNLPTSRLGETGDRRRLARRTEVVHRLASRQRRVESPASRPAVDLRPRAAPTHASTSPAVGTEGSETARHRAVHQPPLPMVLCRPTSVPAVEGSAKENSHSAKYPQTAGRQRRIQGRSVGAQPQAIASVDVDQLTDKVIRAIDRRIVAYRERTARS
jgi:hypothetical protein